MPGIGELVLVGFIVLFVLVGIRIGKLGDALGGLLRRPPPRGPRPGDPRA